MGKNTFSTTDRKIIADSALGGEMGKNLNILCDQIGTRFAGTEGYRKAATFMRETFTAYGLDNVHLEPFEFMAWRRGKPAGLAIVHPVERGLNCLALPYSGSTQGETVVAGVVDVGAGSTEDVEGSKDALKGQLALSTAKSRHRTDVCKHCAECGAVGFILEGTQPGAMVPTGSVANGEASPIPAVSVSLEDALMIKRLSSEKGVRLSIAVDAALELDTTWNVVGELTGTQYPDELIVMGGHLDSHDIGPCAFDNGAGAVHVMETARLLATHRKRLKRTVRFIGFAGEEIGLLGSHHYASAHADELQKAWFMLNSDCPSAGEPHGMLFHEWADGEAYMAALGDHFGGSIECRQRYHCHSDHYPFILQGVPTGAVFSGHSRSTGGGYVHTAADTPDKLSIPDLQDSAAFAARILLRASSDPKWPRRRRSQDDVDALVARG